MTFIQNISWDFSSDDITREIYGVN